MPISCETSTDLVAVSASPFSRAGSVKMFCDRSSRSIELRYMCCALARPRSLPKASRVRSHCSACLPLIRWVPAVSFSPEPPCGMLGVGRSHRFCLTHTSTPPTASAIRTTPSKSIIIQWSM